jgi:hypothetical protein
MTDFKSKLQMLAQSRGWSVPTYHTDSVSGGFVSKAVISEQSISGDLSSVRTQRALAEQEAAEILMTQIYPVVDETEAIHAIVQYIAGEPRSISDIVRFTGYTKDFVQDMIKIIPQDKIKVSFVAFEKRVSYVEDKRGKELNTTVVPKDNKTSTLVIRDAKGKVIEELGPFHDTALLTIDGLEDLVRPVFIKAARRNKDAMYKAVELQTRHIFKSLKTWTIMPVGSTIGDLLRILRKESTKVLDLKTPDILGYCSFTGDILISEVGVTDDEGYALEKYGKYIGCGKLVYDIIKKNVWLITLIDDFSLKRFAEFYDFPFLSDAMEKFKGIYFDADMWNRLVESDRNLSRKIELGEDAPALESSPKSTPRNELSLSTRRRSSEKLTMIERVEKGEKDSKGKEKERDLKPKRKESDSNYTRVISIDDFEIDDDKDFDVTPTMEDIRRPEGFINLRSVKPGDSFSFSSQNKAHASSSSSSPTPLFYRKPPTASTPMTPTKGYVKSSDLTDLL